MATVDYDQIDWLAGQVTQAAELQASAKIGLDSADLAQSAFGDTAGASACRWAYSHLTHNAGLCAESLAAVLSSDVDRFREAVRTYQEADRESANAVLRAASLNVFTGHVQSGNSAEADEVRARHLGELQDAVAGANGPAVVAVDANVSRHDDEQRENDERAPRVLNEFVDDMRYNDAGHTEEHDGRRIDYVFTSPDIAYEPARHVEATESGLSDHDGQAVDIAAPRW